MGHVDYARTVKKFRRPVDSRFVKLLAIGGLLSLFSFFVVQNSVVINVRVAYFAENLDEIRMRLGTALIIAGGLGFGIGWLAARWRR